MSKRLPTRGDHLRAAIAQEAARLMAEHGIQDYGVAKRKAAERYGVFDGPVLPRNVEIEAALAAYQRLFGGREHEENLRRLRKVAVKAMRLLTAFEPRLVGSVLSGTATAHSDVELHVFSDSPEAVCIALMDRGVLYQATQKAVKLQADRNTVVVPGLRFSVDAQAVDAAVFPSNGKRQAPLSPVDGKPMRRAGLDDVLNSANTPRTSQIGTNAHPASPTGHGDSKLR